jgi:hypothetical protein
MTWTSLAAICLTVCSCRHGSTGLAAQFFLVGIKLSKWNESFACVCVLARSQDANQNASIARISQLKRQAITSYSESALDGLRLSGSNTQCIIVALEKVPKPMSRLGPLIRKLRRNLPPPPLSLNTDSTPCWRHLTQNGSEIFFASERRDIRSCRRTVIFLMSQGENGGSTWARCTGTSAG